MEVHLQPEKEAQLAQIAEQRGLKPADLAQQVLSRYLEDDTCFIEAVNIGLAAAERGEFVEHDEVGAKLKQIPRALLPPGRCSRPRDRKSTRLNSSHVAISYAVFRLKKK